MLTDDKYRCLWAGPEGRAACDTQRFVRRWNDHFRCEGGDLRQKRTYTVQTRAAGLFAVTVRDRPRLSWFTIETVPQDSGQLGPRLGKLAAAPPVLALQPAPRDATVSTTATQQKRSVLPIGSLKPNFRRRQRSRGPVVDRQSIFGVFGMAKRSSVSVFER